MQFAKSLIPNGKGEFFSIKWHCWIMRHCRLESLRFLDFLPFLLSWISFSYKESFFLELCKHSCIVKWGFGTSCEGNVNVKCCIIICRRIALGAVYALLKEFSNITGLYLHPRSLNVCLHLSCFCDRVNHSYIYIPKKKVGQFKRDIDPRSYLFVHFCYHASILLSPKKVKKKLNNRVVESFHQLLKFMIRL